MADINQLSAVSALQASDLLALYSTNNGDARKASLSLLVQFLLAQGIASDGMITQYAAPNATGFSVQVGQDGYSTWLLLTPAGAYATGTITLPPVAACVNGQHLTVSSTQAVTTLTVAGNGATVNGAPTTIAANGFFRLRFDLLSKAWYRV